MLVLLTATALAQTPPDNARVLSTGGNVTLTWPGDSRTEYLLQVSLQGQPVFAGVVRGTRARLDELRPGLYRWQVSSRTGGPPPTFYSFQLQTEPRLVYDGAHGGDSPRPGRQGRPGQNGATLNVTLTPGDPYHQLTINRDTWLLSPDSGPLTVSSQGGRGGQGGPEVPAGPVPVDAGGTVIWMPGGPGQPPGRQGPGGAGGRVTATGSLIPRYLRFQLDGGPGDPPGPPGVLK